MWFLPQTVDVLNNVFTFSPRQLHIPNHITTLNQPTAISFRKRASWHLIWFKHATFKKPSSCNISSFYNYTSSTLVKTFGFSNAQTKLFEFSYTFHRMVGDRFLHFFTFFTICHTLVFSTFHEKHHPLNLTSITSMSIPQPHSKTFPPPSHHP